MTPAVTRGQSVNVSIVQLHPRDEGFFKNVNPPMGDEIRFEEPGELQAAREL